MKLEELIQKRFVSTAALAERLTTYNGVPAVFSPEAPGDEQDGWGGETQYPMVTYNYDLQANEEMLLMMFRSAARDRKKVLSDGH